MLREIQRFQVIGQGSKIKDIVFWAGWPIRTIYFIALREIDFWRSVHGIIGRKQSKDMANSPLWSAKSTEVQED